MKNNMPTDVYEYDEAVNKDHVLVPFYLIETATQIPDDGITLTKILVKKNAKFMKMNFVKMREFQNIFHQNELIDTFLIRIRLIK